MKKYDLSNKNTEIKHYRTNADLKPWWHFILEKDISFGKAYMLYT